MLDHTRPGLRLIIVCSAIVVGVAVGLTGVPFQADAQPAQKVFRVGHLSAGGRTPDGAPPGPLREGLRGLGYVVGQNVAYEARFAEGKPERLSGLAADLVRLKVDVIVAQGWRAAMAAKQATSTIPIVIAPVAGDAVASGLIASLARPGGNVRGMTDESVQLSAKRMEILKDAMPKAALIAIIWNADDLGMTLRYRGIEEAARILKVLLKRAGYADKILKGAKPADLPRGGGRMLQLSAPVNGGGRESPPLA